MKLSLAWIFDHIQTDWHTVDVKDLIARFNQMTAEIEAVHALTTDLAQFTLAQVEKVDAKTIELRSEEWNQTITLPVRKDAQVGQWFLIKKDKELAWAAAEHFNCPKGFLMPAVYVELDHVAGGWKKSFEAQDYILEVDNKSITHRPDMWSHRGFAREIAAILDVPLKPIAQFLVDKPLKQYHDQAPADQDCPISISIENHQACKRLTALYLPNVEHRPSSLRMMHRLVRIDSKPIDAIVDATNYAMWDIGQPMHAFDAHHLQTKKWMLTMGKQGEKLTLLDGEEISLTPHDLIVSDGTKPLGLAGIMGGAGSGISRQTTAVLLESGCWDAATIRRSAMRFKKRTDASSRYEKTLDPNQTVQAIGRFLKVLTDEKIKFSAGNSIISIGTIAQEERIDVRHAFLESKLGVKLDPSFVERTLLNLEFKIDASAVGNDTLYSIMVPTFRATKDIKIKEDIAEEVARFYGFINIPHTLPTKITQPASMDAVYRVRILKRLFAHIGKMRETQNYAFYDEEFLTAAGLKFEHLVTLQNPVSEQAKHLATSLVPHILKNVVHNSADNDQLRFFEWGRTWALESGNVIERRSLTAVIFDKKSPVDFYACKNIVTQIFDALQLPVRFVSCATAPAPWFMPYKTAQIMHGDHSIGYAGNVNQFFLHRVVPGDAFIIELDGDFLLNYKATTPQFVPASKYPVIERDISMFVPVATTVDAIAQLIKKADPKIMAVTLIDFFEKDEMAGQRALTFRFVITDTQKTLTKEEADAILGHVAAAVTKVGATVR